MKKRICKEWDTNILRESLNTYNHAIFKCSVNLKSKCCFDHNLLNWILLSIFTISVIWVSCKVREWICNICCNPISYVIMTGKRSYTTNDDINRALGALGTLGTFLTQDVDVIREQIEYLPWIKKVSIRKQWPDTLKIHVVEHIPLAYWNETQIVSATGTIFSIPEKEYQDNHIELMPVLYGPEDSEQVVLANYYVLNEILKSSKFQIKSAKMDARCSWQLVLQNNIHLKLGRNKIIERLYYFIKIYPVLLLEINKKNKYIDYIDLRYHSGFVVKWISD